MKPRVVKQMAKLKKKKNQAFYVKMLIIPFICWNENTPDIHYEIPTNNLLMFKV